MREQIAAHGMASVELMVKAARNRPNLENMVKQKILTDEERSYLESVPGLY